jgi:hypothetical protein
VTLSVAAASKISDFFSFEMETFPATTPCEPGLSTAHSPASECVDTTLRSAEASNERQFGSILAEA